MKKNHSLSEIAVNWHFVDLCNMKCRFCFAGKSCKNQNCDFKTLLNHCKIFGRVNFVGGEPTLARQFPDMVSYAQSTGLKTSVVTNGFIVTKKPHLFNAWFSNMVTVGLSIDSLSHDTNLKIGRYVGNETLSLEDAIKFCHKIKEMGIELKINTVVNSANLHEDFSEFINEVKPDRWKIFQVLPVEESPDYRDLLISNEEFTLFLERHSEFKSIIHSENNNEMANSYIMINAEGYFVATAPYIVKDYQISLYDPKANILEEFDKMNYKLEKYEERYKKIS